MICNLAQPNTKNSIESRKSARIKLKRIIVEPSTFCNLNCTTCVRKNWNEKHGMMDTKTFQNLLSQIKELPHLEKVAFWGIGEPTTHTQLPEMISTVSKLGLETEIITNGMRLNADMCEKLIDSGLDRMVVSVDSTNDKEFAEIRSGATLESVSTNIATLNRVKHIKGSNTPELGIEFTLMKRNMNELDNLRELALKLEASFIIVTNLLPYSEDLKDEILYWNIATESHNKSRSKWNPEIILPRIDTNAEYANQLGKISYEAINLGPSPHVSKDYNGVCPFVDRGTVTISWNGEVSPCVPLMHSYSCYVLGRKKDIVKHSWGNIQKCNLLEIWNKDEFKIFRRKIMENEFSPCVECGGCDMNLSNIEDCFGNLHPTCGDCLWAKGVIQCP